VAVGLHPRVTCSIERPITLRARLAELPAETISPATHGSGNIQNRDSHSVPRSSEFLKDGVRNLDARTRMFYYAAGIIPAMAAKMVGVGSLCRKLRRFSWQLDGGKMYKLRIPPNPPVKTFWSVVVYDGQTRSELQTDADPPSTGSQKEGLQKNADGSVDVYISPGDRAQMIMAKTLDLYTSRVQSCTTVEA
jgi:hypothetical protein